MGVMADSAMVVSAHPLASRTGVMILRKGGNAVDAAIATQLALAVVYPSAGNIGGGGFMVLRLKDGTSVHLIIEKRARQASTNMFLDDKGEAIADLSARGPLACGVPGTVAGLVEAHGKYGRLSWKELVQPAIDLALKGFVLTAREAENLNSLQEDLKNSIPFNPIF